MIDTATQKLIEQTCQNYVIPAALIYSLIYQESGGNPFAYRFEPVFYAKKIIWRTPPQLAGYVPASIPTLATEKVARATSWGLMQIMGETARVIGYRKNNLTELLIPADNIEVGCKYYAHLLATRARSEKTKHEDALLAYNGGKDYPAKVLKHLKNERFREMFASA